MNKVLYYSGKGVKTGGDHGMQVTEDGGVSLQDPTKKKFNRLGNRNLGVGGNGGDGVKNGGVKELQELG